MTVTFEAKRKGLYLTIPSCPSAGTVIDVLGEILKGTIPRGYQAIRKEEQFDLTGSLRAMLISALESASGSIKVYCIENRGSALETIQSDRLKRNGNEWVFLNADALDCNEQALCIVGIQK